MIHLLAIILVPLPIYPVDANRLDGIWEVHVDGAHIYDARIANLEMKWLDSKGRTHYASKISTDGPERFNDIHVDDWGVTQKTSWSLHGTEWRSKIGWSIKNRIQK